MWHKIVTVIVLMAFCMTCGCYNRRITSPAQLKPHRQYAITSAVLADGQYVKFVNEYGYGKVRQPSDPNWGWPTVTDTLLTGWTKNESGDIRAFSTPLSNVRNVEIQSVDVANTIFATLGGIVIVAGIVGLIALATKESCPFIYSYDGARYEFDGEPYGGATCPALQRTDYCALDSLQPVNGEYRLLLTNEVDETQHTDELTLLAVDHPPDVRAVLDSYGNVHTVSSPLPVIRVEDSRGTDLTRWFAANDALAWESDLRTRHPENPSDMRDSLRITFPRPAGATQVKLVINAGTTLWGSQMLKQAEELWGDQLSAWQSSLAEPRTRFGLESWNRREEGYTMTARLRVRDAWEPRGEILGGGPFVTETRIVPLDLEGIEGDTIELLLTPPAGFWQINWLAIDNSPDAPVTVHEISASSAVGHGRRDIRDALRTTDGVYYTAPETGQTARLTFAVPDLADGMARTVFARVSGYYDIHHATLAAKQDSVLRRVTEEPNYFARLSLERFQTWYADQMAFRSR